MEGENKGKDSPSPKQGSEDSFDIINQSDVYVLSDDKKIIPNKLVASSLDKFDDAYDQYFYNSKSVLARSNLSNNSSVISRRPVSSSHVYKLSKDQCFVIAAVVIVLVTTAALGTVFLCTSVMRASHDDVAVAEMARSHRAVVLFLDMDFPGQDLEEDNNSNVQVAQSAVECYKLCRSNPSCTHWTWISKEADDDVGAALHNSCGLKRLSKLNKEDLSVQRRKSRISGIGNNDYNDDMMIMKLVQKTFQ